MRHALLIFIFFCCVTRPGMGFVFRIFFKFIVICSVYTPGICAKRVNKMRFFLPGHNWRAFTTLCWIFFLLFSWHFFCRWRCLAFDTFSLAYFYYIYNIYIDNIEGDVRQSFVLVNVFVWVSVVSLLYVKLKCMMPQMMFSFNLYSNESV